MTPAQLEEFNALTAAAPVMSPEQQGEFRRLTNPASKLSRTRGMQPVGGTGAPAEDYSIGEASGDVLRSAGKGNARAAEFMLDTAGLLGGGGEERLRKAAQRGRESEDGLWNTVPAYLGGLVEPTEYGKRTKALVNPESNIYQSQIENPGPGLRAAKKTAELATELGTTAWMGGPKAVGNSNRLFTKTMEGMPQSGSQYTKKLFSPPNLRKRPQDIGRQPGMLDDVGVMLPATATAVTGGVIGQELGGDIGELAGIVTGAMAGDVTALARLVQQLPQKIKSGGDRLYRSAGRGSTLDTAAERDLRSGLRELLRNVYPDNPDELATAIDTLAPRVQQAVKQGKTGTMGQLTNDPGLLNFEKEFANKSREGGAVLQSIEDKLTGKALAPLADTAVTGNTAAAARLPRAVSQAQASAPRALARAENKAAVAPFEAFESTAAESAGLSKTLTAAKDKAYAAVKQEFTDAVGTGGLPAGGIKNSVNQYIKSLNPNDAKMFKKSFGDTFGTIKGLEGNVNLDTISNVISQLSAESGAIARGNKPGTALQYVDGLKEALYASLDAGVGGSSAARKAAAANYKKYMEQYGKKSAIGKAIGGEEAEAAKKLLPGSDTGVARLDALLSTGDPASMKQAESYLRSLFNKTAIDPDTGKLTATGAKTFAKNYKDQLATFPALKADVEKAGRSARSSALREKDAVKAESSIAAQFGDTADIAGEVVASAKKVINNKKGDRVENMKSLLQGVEDSPSAKEDVRRAFMDEFQNSVTKTGPTGRVNLTQDAFKKFKANRDVYEQSGLFTKAELDRIADGFAEGQKLFLHKDAARLAKLPAEQQRVAQITAALVGAKVGAAAFGSPLIGAALGRKFATTQLEKMTSKKASQIAFELTTNPERFSEIVNRLKDPGISPAEIQKGLKELFAKAGQTAVAGRTGLMSEEEQ